MFLKRSYEKEIIDDFSITDERLDRALNELKVINFFLGGNSVSRAGFRALGKFNPDKRFVKILDIGSGGSDLFSRMQLNGKSADAVSADINIQACRFNKKNNPKAKVVCCDARMLPFRQNSFDVIHASLFLHHFNESDISLILRESLSAVRYGIIINDLRRSVLALAGIKILTQIFSKSRMVKNDGPLSVKRGFIKKELQSIFAGLNNCRISIKRKWAFRWLVYCTKNINA